MRSIRNYEALTESYSDTISNFKSLSKDIEYFKEVMKQAENNIEKLDRNTIYEIIYCHTYITQIQERYRNSDKQIDLEIDGIEKEISLLVGLITTGLIDEAIDSEVIASTKKIDKAKSKVTASSDGKGKVRNFKDTNTYKKKSYIIGSPVNVWLKNSVFRVSLVIILSIVLMVGPSNILDLTVRGTGITEAIKPIVNLFGAISVLVLGIIALCVITSVALDSMYLCLPFIRDCKIFSSVNNLVSADAKNAVKIEGDTEVGYIKVKEPDRIKRNLGLLEYMIDIYPNSERLKEIQSDLKLYKKGKKYFYTIAQIEFIYDRVASGDTSVLKFNEYELVEDFLEFKDIVRNKGDS